MAYLSLSSDNNDTFKDPAMLRYIEDLQNHVNAMDDVGKTIAVTEIVKTVHRELFSGDTNQYRIPDSREAVAQTLITFENSHRPTDLWHYVTPDYRNASVWFQLKSGDNQDMLKVETAVNDYLSNDPPPAALSHDWFGLTHVNVVWQDYMTVGVVKSFSGSFLIVMATLIILFRSFIWGLLAMIPLTFSVLVVYGAAGFFKGNLDTPLALLSAISIGLAVDYAIHFIVRARELRKKYNSWEETVPAVFGEPARAISRNVIVVGVGFLPLLIAPLVPYQMVGILLSSILIVAGVATLLMLPALIRLAEKWLFKA
jgi:predicted RND superfamily exporter protein